MTPDEVTFICVIDYLSPPIRLFVRDLTTSSSDMAWRSHGTDNTSLVDALQQHDIVKSPEVGN